MKSQVQKRKASDLQDGELELKSETKVAVKLDSWRASNARLPERAAEHAPIDVKGLYKIMHRQENALGGGEGLVGVYGTITLNGMHTIIQGMKANCGLSRESSLIDVGSGLGRPLLHAMVDPGVSDAWGIEVDKLKCDKADAFILRTEGECLKQEVCFFAKRPVITCSAVEEVATFHPFTHAFSFWEGVPLNGKQAFGRVFRKAASMQGVAVVQRAFRKDPCLEMRKMGFGIITLVDMVKVKMSGSGRNFIAYLFKKPDKPPLSVLEIVDAQRLAFAQAQSCSRKRRMQVENDEVKQESIRNELTPVAHGTRSRKDINWARRRDIRTIDSTPG